MSSPWPQVRLGKVLALSIDAVPVDPTASYNIAGVYSFGRGLLQREPLSGSETTYKVLHRLHTDNFVSSQLKAWEGALARVPASFDGWFLSPQFPTFRVDPDRLDIRYLEWYCKQSTVWTALRNKARGMGARRDSVSPERFLALEIPLPPPDEQRRIVSRIEELAAKIEEVRRLQREVAAEMDAVCHAILVNPFDSVTTRTAMRNLVKHREPDVLVEPTSNYHFAGVYCFGGGVFPGQRKTGSEFSYRVLTRLRKGDFVYPKLMAWEGALGIVPDSCDGHYVSPEFPVFEVLEDRVLPEVLDTYFRMPSVWAELAAISTGTNVRRRRLHPSAFLRYEIPLPSMNVQLQLRSIKQRVEAAKRLQSETAAELNALLPTILFRAFRGEL